MGELTISVRRDVFRSWLKVSGYTKTRLANEIKVSKGRISQLLNTDQNPSARLIAGVLHVTQLPFDRLFTVKGSPQGSKQRRRIRSKQPNDNQN